MCSANNILVLDFLKRGTPSKFGFGTRCLNSNKYNILVVTAIPIQGSSQLLSEGVGAEGGKVDFFQK